MQTVGQMDVTELMGPFHKNAGVPKMLNFKHEVHGRTYNMFCLSYVSFQIVGCELIIRLFNDLFICVFFSKEQILTLFSLLALTSEFGTTAVM